MVNRRNGEAESPGTNPRDGRWEDRNEVEFEGEKKVDDGAEYSGFTRKVSAFLGDTLG